MRKFAVALGGLILAAFFVWFTLRWFRGDLFGEAAMRLLRSPGLLLLMTGGYAASFWLKALAWRLYAGREHHDPLKHYVHPLLVSLLMNHVLPVKAGDLARTGLLVRGTTARWDDALHGVAAMRVLDLASLLLIGAAGAVVLGLEASPRFMLAAGIGALAAAAGWLGLERWRHRVIRGRQRRPTDERLETPESRMQRMGAFVLRHYGHLRATLTSKRGAGAAFLTLASWLLEGTVVYGVAQALGLQVNPLEAVWVTGMTIAGQAFHVTPGGIGTYETTLTASLGVLGVAGSAAYTAALLSHGYKFAFAYIAGGVSMAMTAVTWTEIRGWLRFRGREGRHE
ncbi:flippase-like domain-containing protein [Paenibacillus sp. MWE-103]|uniref:Phosphatidylglycerol lysyltransferase n=1 Tax=Paenibacillus artemisiicola TaxID=1172618 RepID=A0ABS3WK41_9BACL|nr:lysylphosphatidylglycerol synthase transmembrane domain-containing protein [Paenibacillus artemisiicola]MBO7748681.1 flippase-like domain-containing protein [Paenibacillus artemisiicola]